VIPERIVGIEADHRERAAVSRCCHLKFKRFE
jgi:hypothetical protein